jgi:hypothetical protein
VELPLALGNNRIDNRDRQIDIAQEFAAPIVFLPNVAATVLVLVVHLASLIFVHIDVCPGPAFYPRSIEYRSIAHHFAPDFDRDVSPLKVGVVPRKGIHSGRLHGSAFFELTMPVAKEPFNCSLFITGQPTVPLMFLV